MSTVDSARPSSPLELTDPAPLLFMQRDGDNVPTTITVPGSSSFDLSLFDIIAVGTVKPEVPGRLILTLYGRANTDGVTAEPSSWLPLASSPAEPIGGPSDLEETMWMIDGTDLMIFAGSGKMQGCFKSNVASNPQAPIDLTEHPGDITDEDPLYIFAVGASFLPDEAPPARGARGATGGARAATLCTVTVVNFTMDA
jgi:hypothetical protein